MGLIFESTTAEVISIFLIISWSFYSYITKQYNYWKVRGVPYVEPVFPFGCQLDLVLGRLQVGELFQTLYSQFKNEPYFGVYETRRPVLVIKDPELIKRVLTKDFHHFMNRFQIPLDKKSQYILRHLFNMTGQAWKEMRLKLAPTFTSGKMKLMFFLMLKCSEQLGDHISEEIKINPVVNVKDVLARFTMDIIATCAFGLEINSLSDKNCEFYQVGLNIFRGNIFSTLRRFLYALFPIMNKLFAPRIVPSDVTKFLTRIVRETVNYREKNNVNRNDFLDMLMKIRQTENSSDDKESNNEESKTSQKRTGEKAAPHFPELPIEEITAQCFIFFFAGFETSSSTMAFCLYELSQNQQVQETLHQEVITVLSKHGGQCTYQALQEMPYMDQVINETLRLYASLPSLDRTCTVPYTVPNSELVIPKGHRITIPTYAIHHDPKYYPDPYKFDPERFSAEKISERHPYVHLPFGEGPRMCIGMRFGLMQTKIGLTEVISKFKFSLSPYTHIPASLDKRSFVTQAEKPILLHLCARET